VKPDKVYLDNCAQEIIKDYDKQVWESDNMKESKAWKDWFDEIASGLQVGEQKSDKVD
jgi:hypothetical protein